MFGINKTQLIRYLCDKAAKRCCYIGSLCDCKYTDDPRNPGSEQTGCPEFTLMAHLLSCMTDEEYDNLCNKAGVAVWEKETESLNVFEYIKGLKRDRFKK